MRSKKLIAIGAGCICASGAAHADQTVSYAYDALGRLVQVQIQSGPAAGVSEAYRYDAAGNRTQYDVTALSISNNNNVVNITGAGETINLWLGAPGATGTVTLSENGVTLGTASVVNGKATVNLQGLTKGTQVITASYSGDGTYAAQTMNFTIKVQDLRWLPAVLEILMKN